MAVEKGQLQIVDLAAEAKKKTPVNVYFGHGPLASEANEWGGQESKPLSTQAKHHHRQLHPGKKAMPGTTTPLTFTSPTTSANWIVVDGMQPEGYDFVPSFAGNNLISSCHALDHLAFALASVLPLLFHDFFLSFFRTVSTVAEIRKMVFLSPKDGVALDAPRDSDAVNANPVVSLRLESTTLEIEPTLTSALTVEQQTFLVLVQAAAL